MTRAADAVHPGLRAHGDAPPIRFVRHESALHHFEMVLRAPLPAQRAWVRRYCGYVEYRSDLARRMEVPGRDTVLIINFGAPVRVIDPRAPRDAAWHDHFVSGLYDSYVLVEAAGPFEGLQVDLTPLGAHRLLGIPMTEITNRVVALGDLFGPAAEELVERLRARRGWAARFAFMDEMLAARFAAAPEPTPGVRRAWERLQATGGRAAIGGLARELGWSHRHFIARFRQEIGLPPKMVARVLRFQRVVERLQKTPALGLGELALAGGYYDQAHFNRDFRAFAGTTPEAFRARLLPDGGGVRGD